MKFAFVFLFGISVVSHASQEIEVVFKDSSFTLKETPKEILFQSAEITHKISKNKCPKDFLKEIWINYKSKKQETFKADLSYKKKPHYLKVRESKKTFYVSELSPLGTYLKKLPDSLRNLDLRESRLCRK